MSTSRAPAGAESVEEALRHAVQMLASARRLGAVTPEQRDCVAEVLRQARREMDYLLNGWLSGKWD